MPAALTPAQLRQAVRVWLEQPLYLQALGYSERVPRNTERYLRFLDAHGIPATFFVVGRVAERYPALIREIVARGHEIGCHTHTHVQLDRHTPESLRDDLQRNLEALQRSMAEAHALSVSSGASVGVSSVTTTDRSIVRAGLGDDGLGRSLGQRHRDDLQRGRLLQQRGQQQLLRWNRRSSL